MTQPKSIVDKAKVPDPPSVVHQFHPDEEVHQVPDPSCAAENHLVQYRNSRIQSINAGLHELGQEYDKLAAKYEKLKCRDVDNNTSMIEVVQEKKELQMKISQLQNKCRLQHRRIRQQTSVIAELRKKYSSAQLQINQLETPSTVMINWRLHPTHGDKTQLEYLEMKYNSRRETIDLTHEDETQLETPSIHRESPSTHGDKTHGDETQLESPSTHGDKTHGDKTHGDKTHGDKTHGDKTHGD
eukprot:768471_1